MESDGLQSIADEQFLYLTTTGRNTGLAREIEIWFVVYRENFYLFAEMGDAAGWVKNIRRHPRVAVRIGEQRVDGSARILDRQADRELRDEAAKIARQKYGWGEGLPVEITPLAWTAANGCGSIVA
jgi:deazaflavin-dependent oxidoreductase (nitroreductase family)